MLKKVLLPLFISIILFACKNEPPKYTLRWNAGGNQVIIYSIQMKTVDSLSSINEEAMQALIESVSKMYGENIEVTPSTESLHKGLLRQLNMLSYFAIVRSGQSNKLKIDFITRQTKQYEPIKYVNIFNKFIKKAFFKGTLASDGSLYSEEGAEAWDPKINILFQLPQQPVAIGDSWKLNILPDWQVANADTSNSNKVTLTNITIENGDSIARLEYCLKNSDSAGKMLGFTGNAKFNMTKGKWMNYKGHLSQKTEGMLAMKQVQEITLNQITVEKYKSILKQAQKTDILDRGNDFAKTTAKDSEGAVESQKDEPQKDVVTEKSDTKNIDCPEVYRVQLMAAKNPVPDIKSEFSKISYNVDEIIINNNDYKYKYTVGKECDRRNAEVLLAKIKAFYPHAYILKTPAQ